MIFENVKYSIEHHTTPKQDKYLLAVSGGKDSMVLLAIFKKLGYSFEVAHMNYQLRGEDADLDEQLVRDQCVEHGIVCHFERVDTKKYCEVNGYSTQEGARILRYSWFELLMKDRGLNYIVTAHHQEDNKETLLQNLKRGSGLRGLKAMLTLNNDRIKPMLSSSKSEIDQFARENSIAFRQDASNNSNQYQRNLIRNQLLPKMEEILPGIGDGIVKSIQDLENDYDYLMLSLEKASELLLKVHDQGYRIDQLKTIHPRLLFHLLEKFEFNKNQLADILAATGSGKIIKNDQYEAEYSNGNLYIYEVKDNSKFELIVSEIGYYDLQDRQLNIIDSEAPAVFTSDKKVAFIDADKLQWPLFIREYQQGDRIQPIGMKGTKKLSDYFTDQKIPVFQRANKKVVVSGEEIVWVIDELVSDLFKITSTTKKVLKFETF